MPRFKKASKRGNSQGPQGGSRKALDTSFAPFSGTSAPRKGHGNFTLQEEARNTERHLSFWNTDQKLRDSKVSFVSAGRIVPTEPDDAEAALADMTLGSPKPNGGEVKADEEEEKVAQDVAAFEEPAYSSVKTLIDTEVFDFIVDTEGSGQVQTGMSPPKLRSPSPTPSNSSEEVILFRGRGRDQHQHQQVRIVSKPPQPSQPARKIVENIDAKIRIVDDRIHEQTKLLQEVITEARSLSPPALSSTKQEDVEFESILPQNGRGRGHKGNRRNKNKAAERIEDDAMIADYIANMDAEDPMFKSFNQRDLGGIEDEAWQNTEASSGEQVTVSTPADQEGWDRSDIEDFDGVGTSDGVMGEVQAILSRRKRPSGTQYLVVWEDQMVDEARWVPASTLTSVVALTFIETFEAEEKLMAEFQNSEGSSSISGDDLEIDVEVEEDDDDADLIQRKIDRMSDERIARLLSKQEQLGMGSDEILLFDEDEEDDNIVTRGYRRSFGISRVTANKPPRGPNRAKGEFPSATLLASAYDGFDIMDFDRPSLRKKPKGRKGKLVLDISDSELEASMQAAWVKDREKKKERKQEREEFRAQGVIGNKNGKVNMKQKYKEGIGIYAVKEEIKKFLMGGNTTLSLPPMSKADRKVVHELANAFHLKSKSAGNGDSRFPVLYRTSRTLAFNDGDFAKVDARISRRFLSRMDVGGKRGSGVKHTAGTGGINRAAVSYRDGDIVGGSAPELGADNKGRAMLEKMGWSSGTALGALNNKGIMLPVSHVVKTTKAGLG
ncbi:hypothetical protein ONS95_006675 [Cadophora gregata]|uniref:uncharacterized protein n=1 Tax=Cadophora gregata TaxID=51156 RepID=UPI0026DC405C|nr:uncharacterized protein ONS95_006675 [Cadophora gregata]KAK0101508.1 hypothetical protein ONS95_006675 [Cadophora gregata]